MCRWLAYQGESVLMEELMFRGNHSLIDQSMCSRSAETPTNGDGFGLGWYQEREKPGLFRSIRPAWNDFNLRDLSSQIEARTVLAHIRATSLATVQETNCHPFRYGHWLFLHNGEIYEIEKFRRDLLMAIEREYFTHINGTTDSELMFYLALSFGLQDDPIGALERMAGFVEKTAAEHGVPEALWMTLGVSDGHHVHAVRYASDGQAPTLYHSRDMDDLYHHNPRLREYFTDKARVIVSEPISDKATSWTEIPQSSAVLMHDGNVTIRPFKPVK